MQEKSPLKLLDLLDFNHNNVPDWYEVAPLGVILPLALWGLVALLGRFWPEAGGDAARSTAPAHKKFRDAGIG